MQCLRLFPHLIVWFLKMLINTFVYLLAVCHKYMNQVAVVPPKLLLRRSSVIPHYHMQCLILRIYFFYYFCLFVLF